ncbi:MAG TPA: hypothetical protein VK388_04025 [Pyrinomonadaceae bacterium]|nr:hypothetical protein [Pyrinomonadaceae bacterium]
MARCVSLPLLPVIVAAVLTSGCAAHREEATGRQEAMSKSELVAGGLYSVEDGEGSFRVIKILVLDDEAAHIAVYANKFSAPPTTADLSSLSFNSIYDGDEDVGIMHLPLSREAVAQDRPVLIARAPVTEAELEGYRMWEEAGAKPLP